MNTQNEQVRRGPERTRAGEREALAHFGAPVPGLYAPAKGAE